MVCEYSTVEPLKNGLGFSGPRFIWSLLGSQKQLVSHGSQMSEHHLQMTRRHLPTSAGALTYYSMYK